MSPTYLYTTIKQLALFIGIYLLMKGMAFNPGLRRDSGYWDYMSSIRRLQIICVFRGKQINFRTLKGHRGYFPSLNPRTSAALCDWTSDGQDDEKPKAMIT